MANISENRKLMVENMKKVRAQLDEAKKPTFVIPAPDAYNLDKEAEYFQTVLNKAGVKAIVKANRFEEEVAVYTQQKDKAKKVIEKLGYQIGWN